VLAFAIACRWAGVLFNALEPGWVPTKMGGSGAPDDLSLAAVTQAWLAVSDDPAATVTVNRAHAGGQRGDRVEMDLGRRPASRTVMTLVAVPLTVVVVSVRSAPAESPARRDPAGGWMSVNAGQAPPRPSRVLGRAAEFWKLALGYEDNPPPPPYTTVQEWLTALGEPGTSPQDGARLRDPAGAGPSLSILRVPEPKVAKNRRTPVTTW
jgi:hypothetical protein